PPAPPDPPPSDGPWVAVRADTGATIQMPGPPAVSTLAPGEDDQVTTNKRYTLTRTDPKGFREVYILNVADIDPAVARGRGLGTPGEWAVHTANGYTAEMPGKPGSNQIGTMQADTLVTGENRLFVVSIALPPAFALLTPEQALDKLTEELRKPGGPEVPGGGK